MSSTSCAPYLRLEPRLSRRLLLGGGIGHVLAGVAVIISSIPWGIKAVFLMGIGLSLIRFSYDYGYQHGRRYIARIEWLDGRWRLEMGDGGIHRGWLMGSYAHLLVVILNFRLEKGLRRSLTLLPDSAHVDNLRRLRVLLRIQPHSDKPNSHKLEP